MYRDPWRIIWQVAVSRKMLLALIVVITIGLALSAWLPQLSPTDPVAYAQTLSEARGRFGDATVTMQRIGLLHIRHTVVFRVLLALLAACLMLRAAENVHELVALRSSDPAVRSDEDSNAAVEPGGDRTANLWLSRSFFSLAMHGGSLIILLGFLLTYLWGWRVEDMILLPAAPVSLGDSRAWVALDSDGQTINHSPGVRSVITAKGPGFVVSAEDDSGSRLEIIATATSAPETSLNLILDEDRYFAVPASRLVTRLAPQSDVDQGASPSALIQVYRSPPGVLIQEQTVEGDADIIVGDVTLHLISTPFVQVDVFTAPGNWAVGLGIVLLIAGAIGAVVRSRTCDRIVDPISGGGPESNNEEQ